MALSRGLPQHRLAVGQLLVRLLHEFRSFLMQRAQEGEFLDVRPAHLQIWGNIGIDGIRLTDLAERANLSLAACAELVDQLEETGYLVRRPDPSDGRAKLIFPTGQGRELLDAAGRAVAELEATWGEAIGPQRFEDACSALNQLLASLGDSEAAALVSTPRPSSDRVKESRVDVPGPGISEAVKPTSTEPAPTTPAAVFSPGPRPGEFRLRRAPPNRPESL